MEAFQKFDWDNNESFQEYLRSVEIPASNPGLIEKGSDFFFFFFFFFFFLTRHSCSEASLVRQVCRSDV
jgi:hypothetical protein